MSVFRVRSTRLSSLVRNTASLVATLLLASCGGGGGDGMTPSSTPTTVPSTSSFVVAGAVSGLVPGRTLTLQNGSEVLQVSANGTFRFVSTVPTGGSYAVQIATAPIRQTCSVFNGSGNGVDRDVSIVNVICTQVRSIYVLRSLGLIAQFSVKDDGSLVPMSPATVPTAISSYTMTLDPAGRALYVVNAGANTVSQYRIGALGQLTAMSVPTLATGTSPQSIAIDPAGRFAWIANQGDDSISAFSIASDGSLSSVGIARLAAGAAPLEISVDPSGQHVYVVNAGTQTVSLLAVGTNGALTAIDLRSATLPSQFSGQLAFDTTGRRVYRPGQLERTITRYDVGSDGTLTLPASAVSAQTFVRKLTFDPAGQFAYGTGPGIPEVYEFRIGGDGSLARIADTNFLAVGGGSRALAIDPLRRHLYILYSGGNVVRYAMQSDGTLTVVTTSSVDSGGSDVVDMVLTP